jgi:hypothetical protein
MPYIEDRKLGGLERYKDPSVLESFGELDVIRQLRGEIALNAAKYIVETCGGETTDLRLYYGAMFGRSYEEGLSEHDSNLLVPLDIVRKISWTEEQGQPLLVRAVNYPDDNVDIGVIGSFSEDSFEPIKFEVELDSVELKQGAENFYTWGGRLAIAMRKVQPKRDKKEVDYELSEEVSKLVVCETDTWISHGHAGLEVHPKGTGGVEVGEEVHMNSEHSIRYYDRLAFWLRNQLAPTERMELSSDVLEFQKTIRTLRKESAETRGVSEAKVAAQDLSPTITAFFRTVQPYIESDESIPIDTKALFQNWRDSYDAQRLLGELEVRDLVEKDKNGQLVVSSLGKEAFVNINDI